MGNKNIFRVLLATVLSISLFSGELVVAHAEELPVPETTVETTETTETTEETTEVVEEAPVAEATAEPTEVAPIEITVTVEKTTAPEVETTSEPEATAIAEDEEETEVLPEVVSEAEPEIMTLSESEPEVTTYSSVVAPDPNDVTKNDEALVTAGFSDPNRSAWQIAVYNYTLSADNDGATYYLDDGVVTKEDILALAGVKMSVENVDVYDMWRWGSYSKNNTYNVNVVDKDYTNNIYEVDDAQLQTINDAIANQTEGTYTLNIKTQYVENNGGTRGSYQTMKTLMEMLGATCNSPSDYYGGYYHMPGATYGINDQMAYYTVTIAVRKKAVPPTPTPVTPTENPGRTCQDDGYPAGYYWNGSACVIDATPAPVTPTPTTRPVVVTPAPTTTPDTEIAAVNENTNATYTTNPNPVVNDEVAVAQQNNTDAAKPTYGAESGTWSVYNLMAALVSMLLGIFAIFSKTKNDNNEERSKGFKALAAISGIASVICFIVMENITLTPTLFNTTSILFTVLLAVSTVTFALSQKWKTVEE